MGRRLFCELSPITYRLSVLRCRLFRHMKNMIQPCNMARSINSCPLPYLIYSHNSLIRRKLGNSDMRLQENKAVNLALAAPKVNGVLIRPGETFSFWALVGNCTAKKGYLEGLTISSGKAQSGIGGGLCQFTNLIHWMVLHSPMTITEHHHHDQIDLFPDFGRQIPFGTGTSIFYNYLDYRFFNPTNTTYQLLVHTDGKYLRGELRADKKPDVKYHIKCEDEFFSREGNEVYRNGEIFRESIDVHTGQRICRELLKKNHARVLYDTTTLLIRQEQ